VCDVRLHLSGEKSITVVSAKAVMMGDNGRPYVWLVSPEAKTASRVEVDLGQYNQAGIEVHTGLKANDVVVVEGKEKLSENSSILF